MARIAFVDSIPPAPLGDGFGRTTASSWGTLDGLDNHSRPGWGIEGEAASSYSVSGGTGRMSISTAGVVYRALVGLQIVEAIQAVDIFIPVVATGGAINVGLYHPYATTDENYRSEIVFGLGGAMDVRIRRTQLAVSTTLATTSTGQTYTAGTWHRLWFSYSDSVWRATVTATGAPEPTTWMLTYNQAPTLSEGRAGPTVNAEGSNTNTKPFVIQFDNYWCRPAPLTHLDLTAAPYKVQPADAGTDLSPPPLRRATLSTLLRDGAVHPAAAYDDREVNLALQIDGRASADAAAHAMLALAREVDRPTNILLWQPDGATYPVYLRTYRSSLGSIAELLRLRNVKLQLLAEPFAYGAQQIFAPAAVSNNPAGGQYVDYAAADMLGDVDTPAIVRIAGAGIAGQQSLVAVRRTRLGGLFHELQAESGTNVTDTTEPGNDAAMSGTGGNYTRTTFATNATMTNRVTWTSFPDQFFSTPAYRGTYRVLLRYRKTVSGDVIRVRLLWGHTVEAGAIRGDTVTLPAGTDRRYADLGLVSIPIGSDPIRNGYSGLTWPAVGVPLALQAERASGSGSLDMDCLVFVPADDASLYITWPSFVTGYGVVDGIAEATYEQSLDSAGGGPAAIGDALGIPAAGTFPELSPAAVNRIYVLPNVGTAGSQDDITATTSVTLTYWPRYLYVRPVTE